MDNVHQPWKTCLFMKTKSRLIFFNEKTVSYFLFCQGLQHPTRSSSTLSLGRATGSPNEEKTQSQSSVKKNPGQERKLKEPEIKECEESLFKCHLSDILQHLQWNFLKEPKDFTLMTQIFKFQARMMIKMLKDSRHVCVNISHFLHLFFTPF